MEGNQTNRYLDLLTPKRAAEIAEGAPGAMRSLIRASLMLNYGFISSDDEAKMKQRYPIQ
ncbi:hypothetical protein ACFL3C_04550 [Patescibacteria group bacterium]